MFSTQEHCSQRAGPAYFVVGSQLSGDLYWMAISRTLSSASASAVINSRGPGVLALCRGTATFSSAALAMDPSRHYWCGRPASDRFSHRGLCSANADAKFSSDCSAHRRGDEPERSYLCLGKLPATLQFFEPAAGDAFRELHASDWGLCQPASRG